MEKKGVRTCFLAASAIIMCYTILIGAIADIAAFFPEYSVATIQTGVTAINLMIIIGALLAGWFSIKTSKKKLILFGLSFIAAGGIGGFFFNETIFLFYLWSVVIGTGLGLFSPTAVSLLADYFEGEERNKLAGMQTSFVNGGGVILTFIGGVLAAIAWNFSYLVFLVSIPVLIIFAMKLPAKNKTVEEKSDWRGIPGRAAYYSVSIIIFMLLYNVFPSNIALYIHEKNLGDASLAGGTNAIFMMGGVFFGFVFSKFSLRIGDYLFGVGHAMLVICFYSICFAQSLAVVFIAAFVGGMSISMTMPQALYSVSQKIPPQAGVAVFSLIASISPNIATFISPAAIGALSGFVSDAGDSVSRFTAAGILAIVFAVFQFSVVTARRYRERAA